MRHVSASSTAQLLRYARRGALLLALGGLGPVAFGQSFAAVSTYFTGMGSGPGGVALGDMNGDGRPDIVTANGNTNTVGVLLGQAGGGFGSATAYSAGVGSGPTSVALGDVNGDGRLDIVSANHNMYTVGVLLGQTGGFAAVNTYATNGQADDVALGDVNGDGRLDIVAANRDMNNVAVLLGQASGFAAVSTYFVGTVSTGGPMNPPGVALGDINGDGRLDIASANYLTETAGVLLGQASGGFAAASIYSTGTNSYPVAVALGDVDGDGRLDIITANLGANTVTVLLGRASGFEAARVYSPGAGSMPRDVALGDMNGDGRLDIVTANLGTSNVGVLLGLAGGGFAAVSTYFIGLSSTGASSYPNAVAVSDVSGDGRPDIVVANPGANTVGVLLNTGTFTPLATLPNQPTAAEVALSPNPAHDTFTVQLPAALATSQAELLNTLGQVVRRPTVGAASFRVETSGLAPGVYTLRLQVGGAALARRVVVE